MNYKTILLLRCFAALACLAASFVSRAGELGDASKIAGGLLNPESVLVGFDGRMYVSIIGERGKEGDGQVAVIVNGKAVPFATGLGDPRGIVAVSDRLFVTDNVRVWAIDRDGKANVFADKGAFPVEPVLLNDITSDGLGNLYVSDSGAMAGGGGKVFRISSDGKATLVVDEKRIPELSRPNGVLIGRDKQLLLADARAGSLYRISLPDGPHQKIAVGLGSPDGIVEDVAGNLYVSDNRGGRILRVLSGNPQPAMVAEGLPSAADICLGASGQEVLVPDMKSGSLWRQPVAPTAVVAPLIRDLKNPESVALGSDGTLYVSVIGEFGKDGDGVVMAYPINGSPRVFASGLDDPKGLALKGSDLYVTDKTRVVHIDKAGKASTLAPAEAFPRPPVFLNDIAADADGTLYVSDSGDKEGKQGAVFAISADGKAQMLIDGATSPLVKRPNGVLPDSAGRLWVVDILSGDLLRVNLATKTVEKIAGGLPGGDGLTLDADGNLYISQWSTGKVSMLAPGATEPKLISNQFVSAADTCLNPTNGYLMVPDMKAGTVTALPLPSNVPNDVDQSTLPVRLEQVFPELAVTRPLILTHAGDGTNRVFVVGQRGQVFVLRNEPGSDAGSVFLNLVLKVAHYEKGNEEGFLGLAFHPKFRDNGQFFVYYTAVNEPRRSIISRFKVDAKNPNAADLASEEEILVIPQPYSNHNGGTIAFGPDDNLYVGLGDGGSGGDPHGHGQNLGTLLGSILRIDVDHQEAGKKYAIPKDNPFVGRQGARGEIWAYGVRNIWRLSFDRQTGDLWAGDVGQNIWEEVDLIVRGGNYGWNLREGMHRYTAQGTAPRSDLVEPLWEYHHDVGKSITGGNVYRGTRVPELTGKYLYADYVTGRIWALEYDRAARRVVGNRPIFGNLSPVMSFGEDEQGEVYFLTVNGGVFRFMSIGTTTARD